MLRSANCCHACGLRCSGGWASKVRMARNWRGVCHLLLDCSEWHPKGIRRVSEGYPKGIRRGSGVSLAALAAWFTLSASHFHLFNPVLLN